MELDELACRIYEAAVDLTKWPAALSALADALHASAMSLTIADHEGRAAPIVVAPRTDPSWIAAYRERWAVTNLVRDRGCALPLGEIYDFERLGMARAAFDRTAFYNEFWAPQRLNFALLMLAARQHGAISAVGFYRSSREGRFASDDERLLRALVPHVQRAVSVNLRLMRAEAQRDSMAAMLNRLDGGALLVDAQGRVAFANAAADVLLGQGGGLRISGGSLATRTTAATAKLRGLIAGGVGGIMAAGHGDGEALTVEVVPLRSETCRLPQQPAAMVFIGSEKPSALPSCDQIRATFKLTPAQAALARELLHGDGVPAAAARLGISRSTARSHLLELFQKTGVNRQAELVRLVLQRTPANIGPVRPDGAAAAAIGPRRAAGTLGTCLAWAGAAASLLDIVPV